MKDSTYIVAYLLRHTSMSLYEIRHELDLVQLVDLVEEVAYQESVADYRRTTELANIMASIANTVPRKSNRTYAVNDFLVGDKPRRKGVDAPSTAKEEIEALAAKFKIKLPSREIRSL